MHKEPGDVHMERGGPEGALVLFNLKAIDNSLAESLAEDGTIIGESRFDDILNRRRAVFSCRHCRLQKLACTGFAPA